MSKKNKSEEKKSKQDEKEKSRRRKQTWMVVRRWIKRAGLALLALLFILLSLYWFPAELHYKVTETYTFNSDEAVVVKLVTLLPTSGAYQTVTDPKVNWPGAGGMQTDGRLNVVRLTSEIGAGETIIAEISYRVNLFQGSAAWIGEPVLSNDLRPSDAIQSDAPELAAQAALLNDDQNDQDTVRTIFAWTRQFLSLAPTEERDQDALSTLTNRTAGSQGYANLFTALCRAAEIPARTVTGRVIPELFPLIPITRTTDTPISFQAWNEVFAQDYWKMTDVFHANSFIQHKLLGWTDGRHLVFDDITKVDAVYQSLVAEAQTQDGWQASGTTPLMFVAWSESNPDSLTVTPSFTVQKIWDGRWMMVIALLVILFIIVWLIRAEQYGSKSKSGRGGRE